MKHASLFSGIGGFDLAAEWMGWENVFHCEWNEFGQKTLKHYWPNATSYGDITKTDFTIHRGAVDILTGGFPCQPYSIAGKRLGKEDERHLWPEMLRAIREVQPRWVVGENVRGLTNWNGGVVFDEVQSDLEVEGYEVIPFLLPACAVNAPHRRDRIWFIAHSKNAGLVRRNGQQGNDGELCNGGAVYSGGGVGNVGDGYNWAIANANSNGEVVQGRYGNSDNEKWNSEKEIQERENIEFGLDGTGDKGIYADTTSAGLERGEWWTSKRKGFAINNWSKFPTQSPICSGNDGLPNKLDGITFPKWRNESIKAYGNAIVPQIAYEIFKAIEAYELSNNQ